MARAEVLLGLSAVLLAFWLGRGRLVGAALPVGRLARNRRGAAAIEFAFIAPVLLLLAVGAVEFGIALNNYIELTDAVRNGARTLALSRGGASPYTTTVNAVKAALPNLHQANLTIILSVNGTTCTSDSTCSTALSGATGNPGTVSATYPCKLVVLGHDFAPNCTLSSATTEMIE